MTFYDVWVNVKNGSIAKRMTDEKGSLESVFIKFENNRIYKKFDSDPVWKPINLNNIDVSVNTWEF